MDHNSIIDVCNPFSYAMYVPSVSADGPLARPGTASLRRPSCDGHAFVRVDSPAAISFGDGSCRPRSRRSFKGRTEPPFERRSSIEAHLQRTQPLYWSRLGYAPMLAETDLAHFVRRFQAARDESDLQEALDIVTHSLGFTQFAMGVDCC